MSRFDLHKHIAENGLKYHIETYGCQMNCHDSEKIAGILTELGFTPAQDADQADLVLFNTCCVREHAEKRLYGNVGVYKRKREQNKSLVVGICGCMMQQEGAAERLAKTFPFVRLIFGTHAMQHLPAMLYKVYSTGKRAIVVDEDDISIVEDIPTHRNKPPLAFTSIMQGCDNFCSYCIVPYVRGRERSRKPENIISEVKKLVDEGYKEVMLLGQNVNSYGKGLAEQVSFPELLESIATQTGIERIRFMTSHPKDISEELISVMAKYNNICKQLHLPVQSGSNSVLSRMNRVYTREHYLALIEKVRAAMPDISISTDIIVGFPGETDEDYADTLSLVKEVGYDSAFTFVYSVRTGTAAAEFTDHIPEDIKQKRIMELVALQNDITYNKNKACEGKVYDVLVEAVSLKDENCVCGRTDCGRMVNFIGGKELIGSIVKVKITLGKKTTLYGELVK